MPLTTLAPLRSKVKARDYGELLQRVRQTISRGKARAQDAVEREKVRTSWEIGKLILDHVLNHASSEKIAKSSRTVVGASATTKHILLNKKRADYGKEIVKRLSKDLSISDTELYYMMEFARTYPIFRTCGKLSWAHIQSILRINDVQEREAFSKLIEKENWTVEKTRREVTKLKAAKQISVTESPQDELLVPIRGKLDTYQIKNIEGRLAIDLGFSCYSDLPEKYKNKFKEGDIVITKARVSSTKREGIGVSLVRGTRLPGTLFTYEAAVLDITDGDTLWVLIDLGFGFTTVQKLRLRGIDCPEVITREGEGAKKFVEKELNFSKHSTLNANRSVIITSSKSDKYDRYLADVFYIHKNNEEFLNNNLLEKELAMKAPA